jgi:hypothetical protein
MANRFPLVVDSSNQNIKELPDGDSLLLGDNEKLLLGDGTDLQIYHDGTHNYIDVATSDQDLIFKGTDGGSDITALTLDMSDAGTAIFNHDIKLGDDDEIVLGGSSDFKIYHNNGGFNQIEAVNDHPIQIKSSSENMLKAIPNGAVELYHNNNKKIETTTAGVSVTGKAVGTLTTDNDGSFDMNASNNFKCTPSGNFTLTFTNISAQSGNILLINSGGHTVSAHANTKVDANFLATVSTAGTYLLAYFSDGTNVYMTNSAVYT